MKPKTRSNAVTTVLLFVFLVNSACASWPPSDTIIIDNETIYIEKDEVATNIDSLEDAGKEDVKLKPLPKRIFGVALHVGLNETVGTFGTSLTDLQPLDNFIGAPTSTKGNLMVRADASIRIWQFPAFNGNTDLSFYTGFGHNAIRVTSRSLDENSFGVDSIIRLYYTEGELLLKYFDIFEPPMPIGELDTNLVAITKNVTHIETFDIPLKIRVGWLEQKSTLKWYLEAGVVNRILRENSRKKTFDNYLVNESGDFEVLRKAEFKTQNFLRPTFSFGIEKQLEPKTEDSRVHSVFGVQFNAVLPATALNTSSLYYMDIHSYSFSIYYGLNF